jgi:hypothetical protein
VTESSQGARLTHVDESGAARMVDVSAKDVTSRVAVASGRVLVSPEVVRLLRGEGVPKGDALGVARVAIMGSGPLNWCRCATPLAIFASSTSTSDTPSRSPPR